MLKRTFTALLAALLTLPLLADLSLKTAEVGEASFTIALDTSSLKGSLADKKSKEYKAQCAKDNEDAKLAETIEKILPPGTFENMKMVMSIGGDIDPEAIESAKKDLASLKLIGAIEFKESIKQFFDMIPMLPMIKPEMGEKVDVVPMAVGSYQGIEITEKGDAKSKIVLVLSNDGKTMVFGPPAFVKQCVLAEAGKYSTTMKAVLEAANKDCAGAVAIALPADVKSSLMGDFVNGAEMLDADTKAAIGKLNGIAITWKSSANDVTLCLKGAFEDAAAATAFKAAIIDSMLIPMGQMYLPQFVGADAAFPKTLASFTDGAAACMKITLNEADINGLLPLLTSMAGKVIEKAD